MSKIETAADNIKKENNDEAATEREQQLATDLQLIGLLRENPDFLNRHPELLSVLEIKHQSGGAVSLIERQVDVLRQQKKTQEDRLLELMDVARDNERLAEIRHRLAIDLLSTHDIDDVITIVLDAFRDEMSADYAVIKLFSSDEKKIEQSAGLFVNTDDDALNAFKTMLEHKNTVCGKSTDEQKNYLFDDKAATVKSVAIIPLVAGANLGLIGLGAENAERFNSSMGTEFLSKIGELISASLAVHLEN
ncbi:MAG: DUF484 family protein, partial [Proteobacteria bacterium]|nr:DUF484 family protein [Pseudomonadota bacterium]